MMSKIEIDGNVCIRKDFIEMKMDVGFISMFVPLITCSLLF